jgi:hypothetical protein
MDGRNIEGCFQVKINLYVLQNLQALFSRHSLLFKGYGGSLYPELKRRMRESKTHLCLRPRLRYGTSLYPSPPPPRPCTFMTWCLVKHVESTCNYPNTYFNFTSKIAVIYAVSYLWLAERRICENSSEDLVIFKPKRVVTVNHLASFVDPLIKILKYYHIRHPNYSLIRWSFPAICLDRPLALRHRVPRLIY